MSEETNKKVEEPVSDDTRIQIKAKDAAEQLLPGGKSVQEMSAEDLTTYTANMAKADRLYAKHTDNLADTDREVFDALLLASDQTLAVEERFELAISKFNAVKNPKVEEKAEKTTEDSPKGTMEASAKAAANPLNNELEAENDAPLGDNEDYFKYISERFKKQTTMSRGLNVKN
jgi:hypothetical protein|tara:strand:- start:712 stop:1233 length:522 start_codon:yes stop_codon:yes gene_type:complete